jgi:hypothetical protein
VWKLLEVEQIQNGGRCHGNQGGKNVKFTSNFTQIFAVFINTSKASTHYGEYFYDVS